MGLQAAIAAGLFPFVYADLLKIMLASGVMPGLWRLFGREPGSPRERSASARMTST
jgi:biotin transporter BioY